MKIIKKNTLGLFVVLLITASVVAYWSLSIDGMGENEDEPIEVNDHRAQSLIILSDSIEQIFWQPAIKDTFINMNVVLNILLDDSVIKPSTFEGLRKKINSSYSSSLRRAFDYWKSDCVQLNYESLKSEILEFYYMPECKTHLSNAVFDIRKYDEILGFQSKIEIHIKGYYIEEEYIKLLDQIQSFEAYFSCSGVDSILSKYFQILQRHQVYYEKFVTIDAFEKNKEIGDVIDNVMKFCDDASLWQYHVYYNKFNMYQSKYSLCE